MKIDSDVEFQPKKTGGRPPLYPFAQMSVGESFVVKGKQKGIRLQSAASAYARRHGGKFTTLTSEEGTRCWRIE